MRGIGIDAARCRFRARIAPSRVPHTVPMSRSPARIDDRGGQGLTDVG
ncbi:Hypothetical protein I596_2522 [Dokdonella koreensis DS-123]|uniref:Uncharacterized protein n=1 Tax=Dokdonella koreensis DS-123 TaxID=1300342 RepID=A0A160DVE9_9GAMM|nr:Hypothetical protein I596_2522 [Dokdonella koreensis DS-123]